MKKITLLLFLFIASLSQAQLTVNNINRSPRLLVEQELVGAGVTPLNIKFNGSVAKANASQEQVAYFTAFSGTNLGADMNKGVLLTTGKSQVAIGPNNTGSASNEILAPNNTEGDADLLAISTGSIRNVCIVEFDFVATGNELNFDFVFGSEEYLEFVNSSFNDSFGFFLSGPGISGTFTNGAKNIALVPSTTIPISINSLNNVSNSAYYVNNGDGSTPGSNPSIQYDGFTKVIRATSALQCGGTYHIKLAVGNVGDNGYDSGVFLRNFRSNRTLTLLEDNGAEENLFACPGTEVTISTGLDNTYFFQWYIFDETLGTNVLIPGETGPTLTVNEGGLYSVNVTIAGGCVYGSDEIRIKYSDEINVTQPLDLVICTDDPPPYVFADINQNALMTSTLDFTDGDYLITYYNSTLAHAQAGDYVGYIPDADLVNYIPANYAPGTLPATIYVRIEQNFGSACAIVKSFILDAGQSPSGTIGYAQPTYCTAETNSQPVVSTISSGGIFSAAPAGLTLNTTTGAIVPSTSAPGIYTVTYSIAAGGTCPAYSSPTTVEIIQSPLAPAVISPLTYCQNQTAAVLTATGSNLLWYAAATGGTGSATAPTPSTAAPGTFNFYVSQSNGTCESPRSQIVVNVTATPLAPVVVQPAEYCQNASPVAPLVVTGTALLYYANATGGVGSSTAPVLSTATAGTFNYYVSQTVAGCEGPRANIIFKVNATPAAPVATPSAFFYCQNEAATTLNVSGTGLLWYANATGGVGSTIVPTVSTATVGTTNYYVSQTIAGCESARTQITISVTTIPAAPTVSPITYCQNATAIALTAGGTNLLWYTTATGGTGSATAPIPSTATPGTFSFFVSQKPGCESPRSEIVVTINATPSAPVVVNPAPYCLNDSPIAALNATGTNLLWYAAATGGTGTTAPPTLSTAVAGTFNYYVSQTINGCEGPRANIVFTVTARPLAPGVGSSPYTYCQNDTPTAFNPTGTGLLYYANATGGTGSATQPAVSTATVGTTNYYVSQTVNGCEGPRAMITVNVIAIPPAPTVSPITYCQNATAVALTATGTNLLWYTTATGGTGSATAPIPSTATPGTFSFFVSQKPGCESPRSEIVVTVNATPSAPVVVNPAPYCLNDSPIAALNATGTNLLWYAAATGGTGTTAPPTLSTAVAGTFNYYVSQTINGCEGPRANIVFTVTARPLAPGVGSSPYTYCQNDTPTAFNPTGTGLLYYANATGGTGSATQSAISTATVGTTNYYVSQTVNGCEGPRAMITVNVIAIPPAPTVSPITYCQNATAVALTATGTNLLWYTTATGGTGSATAPIPSTATVGTTTYYVSQKPSCESTRAAIVATINPIPTVTVSAPPICAGAASTVVATPGSGTAAQYSYVWTVPTGATNPGNVASFNTTVAGNYSVVITSIATGCTSASASTTVVVNPVPVAVVTTANMTLCSGGTTSINITSGTPGTTFAWTVTSQTGVSGASAGTGNNIAQTLTTTGNANGSVTYSVVPTANGCTGTAQSITIAVIRLPSVTLPAGPINLCSGQTTNIQVVGSITGTTFIVDVVSPNVSGATGAINAAGFITDVLVATGTNGGQVVYSVTPVNGGCPGPSKSVTVNVSPIPTAVANGPMTVCSGERTNIIINDPVTASTTFSWTAAATIGVSGASAGSGALIAQTLTTIGTTPGTVTYTITPTSNSCVGATTEIIVTVNPRPTAPGNSNPAPICSGNNIVVPILAGISGTTYSWTIGTVNGVSGASAGSGTTIDQTLVTTDNAVGTVQYIIEPKLGDCTGPTATITVTVYPSPAVDIADGIICVDENGNNTTTYTFNTGLSTAQYSFSWYLDGTDLNSSDSSYMASIPGVYTVRVKNNTTNCINEDSATLTTSTGPQIVTVSPVRYFNDDQVVSINVVPAGDYEYQIDNGIFQSSNQFANLGGGSHTVVVRNICDQKPVTFTVITYPKFFTPNGDGYNDFWNIYDLKDQAQSRIYIFDRYGKLIKEMSPQGQGWDGKFNQQLMPGTDYWFKVMYDENGAQQEFKAHFSLKR